MTDMLRPVTLLLIVPFFAWLWLGGCPLRKWDALFAASIAALLIVHF